MRINDWSSDVCSSDLGADQPAADRGDGRPEPGAAAAGRGAAGAGLRRAAVPARAVRAPVGRWQAAAGHRAQQRRVRLHARTARRSEEHTSELQSLMRISYAVFCLKKKNKLTNKQ